MDHISHKQFLSTMIGDAGDKNVSFFSNESRKWILLMFSRKFSPIYKTLEFSNELKCTVSMNINEV